MEMLLVVVAVAVRKILNCTVVAFGVEKIEMGHLDFALALCLIAERWALMGCSKDFDSPNQIIPKLMGC